MRTKRPGYAASFAVSLRLEAEDMLGLGLIEAAVFLLVAVITAIADGLAQTKTTLLGWPGLAGVMMAVLLLFVEAISQFGLQYTLAVRLGRTRRTAILCSALNSAVFGLLALLLAALLDQLWAMLYGARADSLLDEIPLWAYAAMLYLPITVSLLEQAMALLFSPRVMAVFLLAFVAFCQLPQLLTENEPWVPGILASLPIVMPAVGLVMAVIGTAILYRGTLKL